MTKTEPSREEFLEKVASLEEGVQEDFHYGHHSHPKENYSRLDLNRPG